MPGPIFLRDRGTCIRDLAREGWSTDSGSTTNASTLTTLLADRTKPQLFAVPHGVWPITETITWPARTGASIAGVNSGAYYTDPVYHTGTGFGNVASHLEWRGNGTTAMMQIDCRWANIQDIAFVGQIMTVAPSGNIAKIGLHIRPSESIGADQTPPVTPPTSNLYNTAKCYLNNLYFWGVENGIVCGHDLADEGASTYTGVGYNHADGISAGRLIFNFIDGMTTGVGKAIWIRNEQSVNHNLEHIFGWGEPELWVYLERGGRTRIGSMHINGSGIALKVGYSSAIYPTINVGQIAFDTNNITQDQQLIVSDANSKTIGYTARVVNLDSFFLPVSSTGYALDLGPGIWSIRNGGLLKPNSIKMTGVSSGSLSGACIVHLDNVYTYATDSGDVELDLDTPADLVDTAASSGPYLLTWKDCARYNTTGVAESNGPFNIPYADGSLEGGGISILS